MAWEQLIYVLPAVLFAIVFHEMAHGYVSYLLGDPTPKQEKRLSPNPVRHLDPIGTFCLIFFHFGWAKPVRVDPRYYRNPRLGMVWVALAGPTINIILAFITGIIWTLLYKYNINPNWLDLFLRTFIMINIGLGVFNLLPIPPLDGSKIVGALIPEKYYFSYLRFENFGIVILLILLGTGILDNFLSETVAGFIKVIYKTAFWLLGI
ncbi:MAG: site-2 protease family protein [Bacilli bacterium]|nr:site-2 protease family protein [Bacilli bacterium]